MAEAEPELENQVEECKVGKIIDRWVRGKRNECLQNVQGDEETFSGEVRNALQSMYVDHTIQKLQQGVQGISYEDPCFQFGYIYKHSMFSARSLSNVIQETTAMENLMMQNTVTFACLGGGPGSDVLGVIDYFTKYIEVQDFEGQLHIHLYDRKDKWAACWESVKNAIDEELQDDRVTVTFHDFDVTTDDKNKPDLENADVIIMHYFMEEVYSEANELNVVESFDHILQTAKDGALFLYSGMYMYQVVNWVHELLKDNCELLTLGAEEPHKKTYSDPAWIPYVGVNLKNEEDLMLFTDITRDLETYYPLKEIVQRYYGDVVYRLYMKQ